MINIDGKILNMLNEDEYYLFSFLLNYGTVSRPKNDVLISKTGWALKKLQSVKKSLVDKGLLQVNQRFVGSDGKRLGSNEYRITTQLAAKYNGKKEAKKSAFEDVCMVEIEIGQNEVCRIDVGQSNICQSDIGKNDMGIFDIDFKVLKLSIIETVKEILKVEKEKTPHAKVFELENEIEKLNAKIAFLEKPRHSKDLPIWFSEVQKIDTFKTLSENLQKEFLKFCMYRHNKDLKGIILETVEQILKKVNLLLLKNSEQQIIESFDLCIENNNVSFDPAFVENRNNKDSKAKEPQPQDLETYLLQFYKERDIKNAKESGDFAKWETKLNDNLFRITNISKEYKSKNITPLFVFEIMFLQLGENLGGSNADRKLESFKKLFDKQSEYNRTMGNFREIVEAYGKTQRH